MNAILEQIKILLRIITATRRQLIYSIAKDHLGQEASPLDLVDDVVGCAESVTNILAKVVPTPIITGTWTLNDFFERSPRWAPTDTPRPGDVIISPTGSGNGKIRGHVGIIGENGVIMSNDSSTGLWMANFTISSWLSRYRRKGGMPVYFYTLV